MQFSSIYTCGSGGTADALALGASVATREGSNPFYRTKLKVKGLVNKYLTKAMHKVCCVVCCVHSFVLRNKKKLACSAIDFCDDTSLRNYRLSISYAQVTRCGYIPRLFSTLVICASDSSHATFATKSTQHCISALKNRSMYI
jgi:hypothetical protein